MSTNDERRARGQQMLDAVYGAGFSQSRMPPITTPVLADTVDHLFAEIWSRPGLSIKDRRMLVIGATAALGRADLIQIQARGALVAGELSIEQLREVALHLQYYVGWGNGSQVIAGIEAAVHEHEADPSTSRQESERP